MDGGSIEVDGQKLYWEEEDFPIYVLIDQDLSINHTFAAMTAAYKWNGEVGQEVFKPKVYDLSTPAPRTYGFVAVSMKQLGETNRNTSKLGLHKAILHEDTTHMKASEVFYDSDDIEKDEYVKVMVHELGHALTLDHDPGDRRSIMYPQIHSDTMYIMPDDEDRVRSMVLGNGAPANPERVEQRIKITP